MSKTAGSAARAFSRAQAEVLLPLLLVLVAASGLVRCPPGRNYRMSGKHTPA
jgi:hypothetical protein